MIIDKLCPRCKKNKIGKYPALSRRDNKTDICSECGTAEAIFDFQLSNMLALEKKWLLPK